MPNPFSIETSYQADAQRKRRERFKWTVYTSLAVLLVSLIGLLFQGCKKQETEQSAGTPVPDIATATPASNSNTTAAGLVTADTQSNPAPLVAPVQIPALPKPVVTSAPPVEVAATNAIESPLRPEPVQAPTQQKYTVRRGDTLTSIARTHRTTLTALRQANRLKTDRIIVGQSLVIPAPSQHASLR